MAPLLPPTFSPPFHIYSKFNHCMLPSLCWSILNLFFSWFFFLSFHLHPESHSLLTVCPLFSIFPQFSIFPPSSFSPVFFSICCKLKIVPKKAITVVKSLHITVGLYRGATLCLSITTYNCLRTKLYTDSQKYQQVLKRINKHWLMQGHTTSTRKQSKVPRSTRLWTKPPAWGFAAIAANFLSNHQLQDFREGGKCWRALALLLSPHCLLCSWFKLEINIVIFGHST